jgi:signal transduction histidine kinase
MTLQDVQPDLTTKSSYLNVVKILSFVVMVVGVLVMLGWILNVPVLETMLPNSVTMKFNTALSFVFGGLSLFFIARTVEGKQGISQIALPASDLIISLTILGILGSIFLNVNIGIENIFVQESGTAAQSSAPGRPSMATMFNFVLIIIVGILASYDYSKTRSASKWMGVAILAVGCTSVIGYITNQPSLYFYIPGYSTAMAPHTSILFVMLGTGMWLLARKQFPLKDIHSIKLGKRLVSLFIITSIVPSIFIGIMMHNAVRNTMEKGNFGIEILTITVISGIVMAIFSILISKSILRPIYALNETSKKIAGGDFEAKAVETSGDEIGELAKSFNKMIAAIKTNEQLKIETEKLKDMDKTKEEFSSMVTHELKTPLIPIQGYSELLLDGSFGDLTQEQKESIQVIHDSSLRLNHLIQDILDVHKMELGKMRLDIQETTTKYLVDNCIATFKNDANSKGISLVSDVQEVSLKCDTNRILQVLNNLVSNSIKFVPKQTGRIEISTKQNNGSIIFSIQDNGIGIPKDKQANLFQKFYQVDTSLVRKSAGTGLGLAICRGIVEIHKGEMWMESEEGKGSKTYFSIPMEGLIQN